MVLNHSIAMVSVSSLSSDFFVTFVSEWTEISDLCHLDSAVCSHLFRTHILPHLQSPIPVSFLGCETTVVNVKVVKWLALKCVDVFLHSSNCNKR
jgi:hypothetical protein